MTTALNSDRTMASRFAGTCQSCHQRFPEGTTILWSRANGARHTVCPEAQAGPTAPRMTVEDKGVYVLPDERVVQMKANKAGTAVYPKLWVENANQQRITEAGTFVGGEYVYDDDWTARRDLVRQVQAEGHKMTLDEAKAFLLRYGRCVRCGATLKVRKSVERALGPVCVRYFAEGTTGADVMVGDAA